MEKLFKGAQARVVVPAMLFVGTAGNALAQATTPEAGIGTALTTIAAIIAVGGGGLITMSLAKVGWTVGAKWISRVAGRG